jgi:hypothetical protein
MSKKTLILTLGLAGLAFSSPLLAQPWEEVFGPNDSKDEGHRRVTPVTQCPSGRGYIAIGTRSIGAGAVSHVYLVRVNNAGTTLWEHYYDVGADFEADEGFALAELKDGTGFMTTGTSKRGTEWAAHVMRVDCDGNLLFSHIYFPPFTARNTRAVGHDIREARFGDGITTNGGDFLIAGYMENPGFPATGILFRIDPAGGLIWHNYYDTGGNDERFYGLTEARNPGAGPGDVLAVGEWTDGGRTQALVVRVDGNNGQLTNPLLHCMATYGDRGAENFQSVIEMTIGGQTGQFVMAGMSSSPGFFEDLYLVETKPNPCVWTAQVTIGNENHASFREWATDLIEVTVPVSPFLGVPTGSLALTGYAETEDSLGDAFLLFAQQGSLFPITARRYGDHRGAVDFGTSLAQNGPAGPQPQGFVIAGTTFTDWDGTGDPIDLYLIQPNNRARTGCEADWNPDVLDWTWEPREHRPYVDKVFVQEEVHFWWERDDTVVRVCN